MHNEIIRRFNVWHITAVMALLGVALVVFSPYADASIVAEGDGEFTNDINGCLNTYRDAEGIVGDVIKELESSDNTHTIRNSPDWTNSSNDLTDANNGTGTGTVTRVDKNALKKYKKDFPELKDKDFCTALLHELWHSVDADRGTRTPSADRIGGVKRNEVEATFFQNLVHAIRGVPPRTSYGGVDISTYVVIGDDPIKESVQQPEPEPKAETNVSTSFKHVVPGEYSEIYATVTTSPGAAVQVTLSGPGVDSTPTQTITADGNGVAKFTWRIVLFGDYTVSGTVGGDSFTSVVSVGG